MHKSFVLYFRMRRVFLRKKRVDYQRLFIFSPNTDTISPAHAGMTRLAVNRRRFPMQIFRRFIKTRRKLRIIKLNIIRL